MMKKVTFGKNGWLFLDYDANNVMAQHRGDFPLTPDKLERWSKTWDQRWEVFGGHVYFLLSPDPQAIYPENLPFTQAETRPVQQLLATLNSRPIGEQVVYPAAELIAEKARSYLPIYTETDTHWTSYGAFIAYQALMKKITVKHPNIRILSEKDLEFTIQERVGDLGNKTLPMQSSRFVKCRVRIRQSRETFNNGIQVRGSFQINQNSDHSLASCVVFGTSYSYPMIAMLRESFSTLVFCHRAAVEMDIVNKVKPDIVLFEMAERFINGVPMDASAPKHSAIVVDKLKAMSTEERLDLAFKLSPGKMASNELTRYFREMHLALIEAA